MLISCGQSLSAEIKIKAITLSGCISVIDLIHDGRHVGFAIIMQISYKLLRGQTTQFREVIMNILATQMICFTFIECLSPKQQNRMITQVNSTFFSEK